MTTKNIGEFELFTDKLIGKGAWGEVYHGRQKSLDRTVAIKVLKPELTRDKAFVKRFLREAKTLAKLVDEHIIQVYSAGEYEGSYYFIMEYVEGQPLSSFIQRGHNFPVDEVIHIAESVAKALKTAWESPAKIVHRDIKPSNIMVSYSSSIIQPSPDRDISKTVTIRDINLLKAKIKVMDFGLAKVSEGGKDATMAGTIIGTPKYISPEQGLGNPADVRSDIYSLGIVLYEIAAGRIPFESESAVSMIRHHIHDTATAPSQYNPDIPADLEAIIFKCIQKEPEKRYTDPEQLLEDLTALKQQRTPAHASSAALEATMISDVVRRKKKLRTALYSGIVGLVIIAGLVLYMLISKPDKTSSPSPEQTAGDTIADLDTTSADKKTTLPGPKTTSSDTTLPDTTPAPEVDEAKEVLPPIAEEEEDFKVKVWANKDEGAVYKEGEIVKFHFQTNRDSYIYLYHRDAAGKVIMLFPNGYSRENNVKANQLYTIPDKNMDFDIKVTGPSFGTEQVKAIASLQPIKDMDIKPGEKDFRDLGKLNDLNEPKVLYRSLKTVPKEARADHICTITTVKEESSKNETTTE